MRQLSAAKGAVALLSQGRNEVPMEKAVLILSNKTDSSRWQNVLKRLGVEAGVVANGAALSAACRNAGAGLLFIDRQHLTLCTEGVRAAIETWSAKGGAVVVIGSIEGGEIPFSPVEILGNCFDPLVINDLLVRFLPHYSRRQPRLDINLPGLFSVGKQTNFCEILSIGPGGAFIKTGGGLPEVNSAARIHIPLMGMRKELELEARVVRHVIPCEDNNYLQGFGVSFDGASAQLLADLGEYLKHMVCEGDALQPFSSIFCPSHAGFGKAAAVSGS